MASERPVDADPDRPRWKVVDDPARRRGASITVDGVDVTDTVSSYTIVSDANSDSPYATLHLNLLGPVEVTTMDDAEPRWHGLDRLPDMALLAEIARRGI